MDSEIKTREVLYDRMIPECYFLYPAYGVGSLYYLQRLGTVLGCEFAVYWVRNKYETIANRMSIESGQEYT